MATILKTVAGNTAPPLLITCERQNADGTFSPINLTGCAVILTIKGSTVTQTNGVCTVATPASSGVVQYVPLAGDFPVAGSYKGDVRVYYTDGTMEILYDTLKVKARAKLA